MDKDFMLKWVSRYCQLLKWQLGVDVLQLNTRDFRIVWESVHHLRHTFDFFFFKSYLFCRAILFVLLVIASLARIDVMSTFFMVSGKRCTKFGVVLVFKWTLFRRQAARRKNLLDMLNYYGMSYLRSKQLRKKQISFKLGTGVGTWVESRTWNNFTGITTKLISIMNKWVSTCDPLAISLRDRKQAFVL